MVPYDPNPLSPPLAPSPGDLSAKLHSQACGSVPLVRGSTTLRRTRDHGRTGRAGSLWAWGLGGTSGFTSGVVGRVSPAGARRSRFWGPASPACPRLGDGTPDAGPWEDSEGRVFMGLGPRRNFQVYLRCGRTGIPGEGSTWPLLGAGQPTWSAARRRYGGRGTMGELRGQGLYRLGPRRDFQVYLRCGRTGILGEGSTWPLVGGGQARLTGRRLGSGGVAAGGLGSVGSGPKAWGSEKRSLQASPSEGTGVR